MYMISFTLQMYVTTLVYWYTCMQYKIWVCTNLLGDGWSYSHWIIPICVLDYSLNCIHTVWMLESMCKIHQCLVNCIFTRGPWEHCLDLLPSFSSSWPQSQLQPTLPAKWQQLPLQSLTEQQLGQWIHCVLVSLQSSRWWSTEQWE